MGQWGIMRVSMWARWARRARRAVSAGVGVGSDVGVGANGIVDADNGEGEYAFDASWAASLNSLGGPGASAMIADILASLGLHVAAAAFASSSAVITSSASAGLVKWSRASVSAAVCTSHVIWGSVVVSCSPVVVQPSLVPAYDPAMASTPSGAAQTS
jgi:hypothetical protein